MPRTLTWNWCAGIMESDDTTTAWSPLGGAVPIVLNMTKRADYALLALSHLATAAASNSQRLLNTKEIAEHFDIPCELLAKILQVLAKHGIVASHPGPTGGYRLMKQPSEISVAEIVTIVDGPLSMLHCSNGHETSCKQYDRCTIRDPLAEIEIRVLALLNDISLLEISGPVSGPKFEDYSQRNFAAGIVVG